MGHTRSGDGMSLDILPHIFTAAQKTCLTLLFDIPGGPLLCLLALQTAICAGERGNCSTEAGGVGLVKGLVGAFD